jgi:FtsH-binding integral membrane protein
MARNTFAGGVSASRLRTDRRGAFISRTYLHLLGAVLAFTAFEVILFKTGVGDTIARAMLSVNWLLILGAFMVVGWLASRAAYRAKSLPAQYAALAAYVLAQGLLFVPMLYRAQNFAPGVMQSAATVTVLGFVSLTALVFVTRQDFSFLGSLLWWGGIVALVLIVASILFGWHLGTWFSVGMIALAGCAVLYDTSKVMRRFSGGRHVAAALQLFASIALLFWYVLRLFMGRR